MGRKSINLIGKRFGKLVVLKDTGKKYFRSSIYECVCDCGEHTDVASSYLRNGSTSSCGCIKKEVYEIRKDKKIKSDNTSGYNGISFHKKRGRWYAYITLNKKLKYLGSFENIQDAVCARRKALKEYLGIEIE